MPSTDMLPVRSSICLDCRTALTPGEACDGGRRHRVVSLASPEGKKRLVDEVWGPANLRRQAKRLVRAGGGGAAGGSVFQGCGGDCGGGGCADIGDAGEGLLIILAVVAVALAAVVVVWLVFKLVTYLRAKADKPKPFGALTHATPIDGRGVVGVVIGEPRHDSPVDPEPPSVAYRLEYKHKTVLGGDVFLRDAATGGFDVKLEDRRVVRVFPGRIRLEGVARKVGSDGMARARDHLAMIDPHRPPEGGDAERTSDPFPFDHVLQTLVAPGDSVKIYGPLRVEPDSKPHGSAYREGATVLVPRGVPEIRVLSR